MQSKFVKQAIKDLEAKAAAKKLSVYKMCKLAKVNPSSYYRWKHLDYSPTLMVWGRLHEALDKYESIN